MSEAVWIIGTKESQPEALADVMMKRMGYDATILESEQDMNRLLEERGSCVPTAIVWDIQFSSATSVIHSIRKIKAHKPHLSILVLIPYGGETLAEQAVEAGASDFLSKPIHFSRLKMSLRNIFHIGRLSSEITRLERKHMGRVSWTDMVGENPAMKTAVAIAKSAAMSKTPVWIHGEQGTGKELLARAIHGEGQRAGRPFVVIDCKKKVFHDSDALLSRLREAEYGTVYIKSMESLPTSFPRARLDALMQHSARMICAIATGLVDETLVKSLPGITITLPPLRERKEDIAHLAKHLVRVHSASENKCVVGINDAAVDLLLDEDWHGNVRQLSHLLFRAVMLCNQEILDAGTLRLVQQLEPAHFMDRQNFAPSIADVAGGVRSLKAIEEEAIVFALRDANGCMTRAARNLGIGRSTLYRRVGELGLNAYIPRPNQMTRPAMKVS